MEFKLRHIGLILTFIGTVLLAFSVKVKSAYDEDILRRVRMDDMIVPSMTYINQRLFRGGLACVAIGSLMQW